MKNFFDIFTSVNILVLFILLVVIVIIILEISALKKTENVKKNVTIPDYDEKKHYDSIIKNEFLFSFEDKKIQEFQKNKKLVFIVSFIIFIFLTLLIFNFFYLNKRTKIKTTQENVSVIKSSGIYLFDSMWNPLDQDEAEKLIRSGKTIYIGIETIDKGDIDKARIRVNESSWSAKHETSLFNKEKNIYYIEYKQGTIEASLIIEAQLHSKDMQWLGN